MLTFITVGYQQKGGDGLLISHLWHKDIGLFGNKKMDVFTGTYYLVIFCYEI